MFTKRRAQMRHSANAAIPRMMRNATTAALVAISMIVFPGVSSAQAGSGDPRAAMQAEARAAMAPFDWLVGEWEGTATVVLANGQTMTMTQKETVSPVAFGTAQMIRGRGFMIVEGVERQLWDAAALFSYDVGTKRLQFASTSGSGSMKMFNATANGEGFTWGYTDAKGTETRYVIRHTADGKWHEVGSESHDGGKRWTQTIELTLTKR